MIPKTTIEHFQNSGIRLPTFAELADPDLISDSVLDRLATLDANAADPLNLFRIHWYNSKSSAWPTSVPAMVELPESLTGVAARIVVLLGDRFPLIGAHKVLSAYACLVPRLLNGEFDPNRHRAVWPSTGNYCRGGVALSRILGCRGVAVLPEGMSRERFEWLEKWVDSPADIVRTPGTESNVKEIYDRCDLLEAEDDTVVLNQFSDFGNHLAHYACTGRAAERAFDHLSARSPRLRLAAFVAASGSGGTLAAGDYLKERFGSQTAAVEAVECPTMLSNGFGEHNIQGIGDKHIPLIHNVMNTDFAIAVSDRATDGLDLVFQSDVGRRYLRSRNKLRRRQLDDLDHLGLSAVANVVAAVKLARYLQLSGDEVVMTVATDGASMYASERQATLDREFSTNFDTIAAAETFARYLSAAATDHVLELRVGDRSRIFNLGYYTWVEQRGVELDSFEARREQSWWRGLRDRLEHWDDQIDELNRKIASS